MPRYAFAPSRPSLDKKLANATTVLAAASTGNQNNVCSVLGAFINETTAQAGKQLTELEATQLVGHVDRIRAVLGCQ